MSKRPTTFVGTAVFITAVVGAIALGVWFARALFERFLSTPHTIAGITIMPYGHNMESLLSHSFDSIKVAFEGNEVKVSNPNLDITLLGNGRGARLEIDSVIAYVRLPDGNRKKAAPDNAPPPAFPNRLEIPVAVQLDIKNAQVMLSDGRGWQAKKISIKNYGREVIQVQAEEASGDFLSAPVAIDINTNFETQKLKIKGNVKSATDSVTFSIEAPKNNLASLRGNTNVSISKPEDWIPVDLPNGIPVISKLNLTANATVDLQKDRATYNATINTKIDEYWPLMAQNATIKIAGDQNNLEVDALLKNNEGGSIQLNGSFDKKLNGFVTGQVRQMSAEFGPQMMPMDATIKSAEFYNKQITVEVETRQGSLVDGVIDLRDSLMITFTGDISPYEPWALDWTQGNLTLGARTKLYGAFDGHSLKVLAKINSVINAYHMKADSLQVTLNLNLKGIDFTNGVIYTDKETFDFDGDVKWNDEHPHTSWNVSQQHGGKASAYINIGDTIAIDVDADHAVFSTVPFSDINLGRNIDGLITGKWHQDFSNNIGQADISIEGNLDAFKFGVDAAFRQNGDTIFIDKFDAMHNQNMAMTTGAIVLPNDSNPDFHRTGFLPVQVLYANISSHEFSIPLLLEALNDSTLTSGMLNGDLSYKQGNKLIGNLDFFDIKFRNIPSELFNIRKLNVFAENDKVELNSYLDIGGGGWTGNTQIIINNIFNEKRHVSFSHGSNNGGTLWAEGFIDNDFIFKGTVDANGSWYIPKTVSEIKNTDLHIDVTANLKNGLKGIVADMRLDSTVYEPPRTKVQFPIYMRGHVENGLLDIYEARTKNDSDEVISATLQFSLDSMKIMGIDINSDRFTIQTNNHWLLLENVHSHTTENEDELLVTATIPKISYKFTDEVYGTGEASARGNIGFSIPHWSEGLIKNNTISGNIIIDKAVFRRDFDIDITPTALDKYLTMFNNFVARMRSNGVQEEKISVASPINLSLHVSDSQMDSIAVVTPFATFPLTVDIWILGNTVRPLLRGDISNSNSGFIGIKDVYQFDLNSFLISWNDVPWQNGIIDVSSSQYLPYCSESSEKDKETCPINLDIQGTLSNLQAIPSSNCGTESSAASIYYNILLGCIAENNGEETDWNKLAGKAIGKVISSTANKTLGGDYIGDIEMKVMLFENNTTSDKDSSYFKIPLSLDRWVKNLSLIFGYTQDQSVSRTYDQSLQFGMNYTLPFFQEEEFSHKNHLSPSLSLNAMLISKQYLANTNTGTESDEAHRLEKNIGVDYIYKFWNPCLLGMGHCEEMELKENPREDFK